MNVYWQAAKLIAEGRRDYIDAAIDARLHASPRELHHATSQMCKVLGREPNEWGVMQNERELRVMMLCFAGAMLNAGDL